MLRRDIPVVCVSENHGNWFSKIADGKFEGKALPAPGSCVVIEFSSSSFVQLESRKSFATHSSVARAAAAVDGKHHLSRQIIEAEKKRGLA